MLPVGQSDLWCLALKTHRDAWGSIFDIYWSDHLPDEGLTTWPPSDAHTSVVCVAELYLVRACPRNALLDGFVSISRSKQDFVPPYCGLHIINMWFWMPDMFCAHRSKTGLVNIRSTQVLAVSHMSLLDSKNVCWYSRRGAVCMELFSGQCPLLEESPVMWSSIISSFLCEITMCNHFFTWLTALSNGRLCDDHFSCRTMLYVKYECAKSKPWHYRCFKISTEEGCCYLADCYGHI